MANTQPDFKASLIYRSTIDGGRKTPAKSGYRPSIKFPFSEMQTSGQQTFINKQLVFPGDSVEAYIKILSVDYYAYCLTVDMEFEFREGSKIIGTGKILEIFNKRLVKL